MSRSRELVLAAGLLLVAGLAQAQSAAYPGIGRAATPKEIAAWDIDVRPDFKGLPKGSGSVAQGMEVWEAKCASCHGVFGESNEVFSPLVGGTTKDDVKTGRVARLNDPAFPGRTTLMKVSNLSTLWDYIYRAMPWTQPKSLKPDEVYAVTAYLLSLGGVVPDNYTLSDQNIADAQKLLPNRNGMTTQHAMWPGKTMGQAKPDVQGSACMKNCTTEPKVSSFLPDFAKSAHGNLAEQNRTVGAQRGVDTSDKPAAPKANAGRSAEPKAAAPTATPVAAASAGNDAVMALLNKYSCTACHAVESKGLGPSFRDVAKKHGERSDAVAYLTAKIQNGGSGVWGAMPMPPQSLSEAEARSIGQWLAAGARK